MSTELKHCPACLKRVHTAPDGRCPNCDAAVPETALRTEQQPGPKTLSHAVDGNDSPRAVEGNNAAREFSEEERQIVEFFRMLRTQVPNVIVTKAIMALNIAVFLAMTVAGVDTVTPSTEDAIAWGANYGPMTLDQQWWRLVTAMFLHFGIIHLAFNMWVLWNIGPLVERLVGHAGFAIQYMSAGIAGSLASLAWNPTSVSAGASGAVFGIAGALLALITFRRRTLPPPVRERLQKSVLTFVGLNVVVGFAVPRIDQSAHLGGLAFGFVVGAYLIRQMTAGSKKSQGQRNGIASVVSAAVLAGAAFSLPEAPPDFIAEMRHFADVEHQVIQTNNRLAERLNEGTLSGHEFADLLEEDVLIPWTELRKRTDLLSQSPHVDHEYLTRLLEYTELREQSWRLRIEGIRENDWQKIERANQASDAAENHGTDSAASTDGGS